MVDRVKSPSYPSLSLPKCLDLAEKIRRSALKGTVDTHTAVQLMGFSGTSGPATSALSALKRFGLLEGRDQSIRVSDLARRILQPLDDKEKAEAIQEAVSKPELYADVFARFGGDPPSDIVISSYLMRTYDFSQTGADTFVKAFRDTVSFARNFGEIGLKRGSAIAVDSAPVAAGDVGSLSGQQLATSNFADHHGQEVLLFRLAADVSVRIVFDGQVTKDAVEKLAKLLDLTKDSLSYGV